MMLYDSFLSLNEPTLSTGFEDTLVTRIDLDFATKKAVASYRCLADSSKIAAYKYFLICCEQALTGVDEASLLEVVINYLSNNNDLNDKDACEKLTQLFCLNFKHQSDALSIAAMGLALVDRPIVFAAFVRYMLQCEVLPVHILSTHLLHNYFRYYMNTVSQTNNPIQQLYRLFEAFEDSKLLCELARQVGCFERGFGSYALDSSIHPINDLVSVKLVDTPLRFTPNTNNLRALYVIFQVDFLAYALYQWDVQKNNTDWVSFMTERFNNPYVVITQLPLVINSLHENVFMQKPLSRVLNNGSLSILVNNHVFGVLNLIPFCPQLVDMVALRDLPAYFKELKQQNTSGPALFSSLFIFFSHVKNTNIAVASLLFSALLDAIHIDPSVLEDTVMIGKLRKFPHINTFVNEKVRALEVELDLNIQLQTRTSIEDMKDLVIGKVWRNVLEKICNLKEIVDFDTTVPMDSYQLYSRLASAFIKKSQTVFDLQAFILFLGFEDALKANITPYELMLVELLTTIDDEQLRAHCIQILDTNVNRSWRESNYDNRCCFKKATMAGNLGLIKWMDATNLKNKYKYKYNQLALAAAYLSHWEVVSYFHQKHSLSQGTVNQLFQIAVSQETLRAIPVLWTGKYRIPDIALIDAQFKLSVQKGDLGSIYCFIACPRKPRDKVIKNAFNIAIEQKHFEVAKAIADGFSGKPLLGAIDLTLKNAARLNQCDVLSVLSTFKRNKPGRKLVERAFVGATRANHLDAVKQLVRFSSVLPSLQIIQEARDEASNKKLTHIENYLSILYKVVNKQHAVFFKKNTGMKRVVSLLRPTTEPHEAPIRHASSYNEIYVLQQHGLFKTAKNASPTFSESAVPHW